MDGSDGPITGLVAICPDFSATGGFCIGEIPLERWRHRRGQIPLRAGPAALLPTAWNLWSAVQLRVAFCHFAGILARDPLGAVLVAMGDGMERGHHSTRPSAMEVDERLPALAAGSIHKRASADAT